MANQIDPPGSASPFLFPNVSDSPHLRFSDSVKITMSGEIMMSGALSGYTVIDVTQSLCGPFCSMRLGDGGAEVLKIEPLNGDVARTMGPPFVGNESALFLSLNRNKKSLALDVIQEIEHPTAGRYKTIRPVWNFAETKASMRTPPPALGQHTEEILRKLGFSSAELQRLRRIGIAR